MKTPREKMMNDPQYVELVNVLEHFIERAQFTPSELREAAVMASINYEMRNVRNVQICPKVEDAFRTLDEFVGRKRR